MATAGWKSGLSILQIVVISVAHILRELNNPLINLFNDALSPSCTEELCVTVTLWTRIREVPSSILGFDTRCPEYNF
jgi:hypothetical protein